MTDIEDELSRLMAIEIRNEIDAEIFNTINLQLTHVSVYMRGDENCIPEKLAHSFTLYGENSHSCDIVNAFASEQNLNITIHVVDPNKLVVICADQIDIITLKLKYG